MSGDEPSRRRIRDVECLGREGICQDASRAEHHCSSAVAVL